jgi:predicted nucleic acid-binding protein
LSDEATVYLDTNIFLNVVYKELPFQASSAALLRRIQANDLHAITSVVTLAEVMLVMDASGFGVEAEKALLVIEDIRYLSIVPLDKEVSREAARYVLKDKITIHDAYHLATALQSEVQYFVTRDKSLSNKIKKYIGAATPEQVP